MGIKMNDFTKIFMCLILFLGSSQLTADDGEMEFEWFHDLDFSLGFNDNIGQAEKDRDIIEDQFLEANYSLISNIELDDDNAITLKGFLETTQQDILEDLDRATVGLQFIFRFQLTRGYLEPFYQFNMSIQDDNYGVVQRDSTVTKGQFFATKRLSDTFTLVGGIEHWLQDSDGTVFDLYHNKAFINLDLNTHDNSTWYLTYSYRQGEIWSTAQATFCNGAVANDIFPLISWSLAIEADEAFNNSICGDWLAYKFKADTETLSFGLNYGVGDAGAVDLSVILIESTAEGNINYQSTVLRASYLVRF